MTKSNPIARPVAPVYRPGYSWYVVGLLAMLFAISFMDRFMLSLVIDPVSRELGIGDGQMALLLGAGFAAVYALGGLPIAQILDQGERRMVLIGGVVLWSATTFASAFATTFTMLAACRAGVALGEAVLTPAAVSLIADQFPREKRGLPVAVYAGVSSVMVTGAFIVDGAALQLATTWASAIGAAPWRIALALVALPGLLIAAILYFTVQEPARTQSDVGHAVLDDSAKAFVGYLSKCWRFYLPYYLGTGLFAMYTFATVTWTPTLLMRRDGFDPAMAGYLLGAVGAPSALVGAFLWPWMGTWLERRGRREGIMTAYLLSMVIAAPIFIAAPLARTPWLMLAGFGVATLCLSSAGSLTPLAIQSYAPNRMRARLVALGLLSINLIGYTIGPILVVAFAQRWPDSTSALGYGLACVGVISALISVSMIAMARRAVNDSPLLDGGS